MNILVIAPHPDDEIIGIGGTIYKRVQQGDSVYVCIVTKGTNDLFPEELILRGREECVRADKLLGVKETIFLDFPASKLETVSRSSFNSALLELINKIRPEEVYIPHRGDMQLDHQLVADAAMVALRPKYVHKVKRIYAYETLSETGWNIPNVVNEFIPNVFVDISQQMEKKMEAMRCFKSQLADFPNARSLEAIEALSKFRGALIGVNNAECFSLIREIK